MKAVKPIIHGRDHLSGGADPIPGLLPVTQETYSGLILAHPCLQHYWRGHTDDRKGDWNLTTVPGSYLGITYPIHVDEGPVSGDDDGAMVNAGPGGTGPSAGTGHLIYPTGGTVDYWAAGHPYTIEFWARLDHPADPPHSITSQTLLNVGSGSGGLALSTTSANDLSLAVGTSTTLTCPFPLGVWAHIAIRFDGTTTELRLGNVLMDSAAFGTTMNAVVVWLNTAGPGWAPFNGASSDLAIYDCALTDAELGQRLTAQTITSTPEEGWVPTSDGAGGTTFQPPAVTVTHPGGVPDETPADSTGGSGPVDGGGWHLNVHTEVAVLYDASPGRFDVPSRKWTRVPFNTVRIMRTWEPTVGAATAKTAWLPDDRNLTGPARDGVLHVNAQMAAAGTQQLSGWFSIEYPVLDFWMLPDDDPEIEGGGPRPAVPLPGDLLAAPDTYARAARFVDVSHGTVIRNTSYGPNVRWIWEWQFWDDAFEGSAAQGWTVDNPYPTYPPWPARPLNLPGPYPKQSPTDSRAYYVDDVGNAGFDGFLAPFGPLTTSFAAGVNVCLQAWQDSPWTIRFSTDEFPAYKQYLLFPDQKYKRWPYLALAYSYDPATIDHTTGKVKL